VPGCPARITVSAGLASLENESDEIVDLLRRADRGLYRAKNEGRNQVCVGQGLSTDPLADA
jgi:diguanylate cyclase (GGDEF)-like protein